MSRRHCLAPAIRLSRFPIPRLYKCAKSPRCTTCNLRPTSVTIEPMTEECTAREVLDRVGGKWSIAIIVAAARGPVRFTELERSIDGISRRMLTLTLRNLERDGLLTRRVHATVPPKVEYE